MNGSAPEAFFVPDAGAPERFTATELTRGPWSRQHQHAGPPSALLARAIERACAPMVVARITVELMRALPIAPLRVQTVVLRAGRKVQWLDAELADADGQTLARARALCLRVADIPVPPGAMPTGEPVAAPQDCALFRFPFFSADVGYHTAMESRLARGRFGSGAVAMWMRMRCPLVAGEPVTPLQRVMTAADSGNGVSAALDVRQHSFVNPELTVHLHRLPEGEWICLDARTTPQGNGMGLAETRLLDVRGEIGRGAQSLLIEARS